MENVSAFSILQRASEHMQARSVQYDKPEGERSMAATVQAFNSITGHNLFGIIPLYIVREEFS